MYFRHDATGHRWSKDTARHGGCAFKVYEQIGSQLVWIADADEFGDYIIYNKHKGPTGTVINLDSTDG